MRVGRYIFHTDTHLGLDIPRYDLSFFRQTLSSQPRLNLENLMKFLYATPALLLAGCMGEGVVSPVGQETLATFNDGSAVVRVIAEDAAAAAAATSTSYTVSTARVPTTVIPAESPFEIEITDLSPLLTSQFGEVYGGTLMLNGNSYDVRMFTDNLSSTELISAYDALAGEKYTIVTGDQVSNLPTENSTYTYEGQNLVAATNNTDFNAGGGTFIMSVNFSTGAGELTATSNTAATNLTGQFIVDTSTGYFSGDDLALTAPNLQGPTTAVITGSFHGDGAVGVSGLYYDAGNNPLVNGAIIGSRDAR